MRVKLVFCRYHTVSRFVFSAELLASNGLDFPPTKEGLGSLFHEKKRDATHQECNCEGNDRKKGQSNVPDCLIDGRASIGVVFLYLIHSLICRCPRISSGEEAGSSQKMMVQSAPLSHNHRSHDPTRTVDSAIILPSTHQYNQRETNHRGKSKIPESNYSTLAGRAIGDGNYRKAVEYYRLALTEYLGGSQTVVDLVNAAATCFNLGALSKKLQKFQQAADYFCKAEELYKSCFKKVGQAPINDSTDGACDVCLYQLIVETLQARAHLHYKYQSWLDEAIECHEEVVDVLDQQLENDRNVVYFKIRFTRLSQETRWNLLMTSLQSLGKFYVERGDFEDGLVAYQEALAVLKEQHSKTFSTKQRQDEIMQIIRALSDIYMKKHSSTMGVPQLRRLATIQEDLKHWSRALSCWERVLYLESQKHGEESVPVADALCQIARVMTAQGNREGALDLYHAALAKYQQTETPLPREAVGNTINIFCQLMLHDDALAYLENLLPGVQSSQEHAWILCQRGRIYLEQGLLPEARQALRQSAEMFDSKDAYVQKLLQKLDFLQQRSAKTIPAIPSTSLDMPLESILECDENSTMTQDQSEETPREQSSKLLLESPGYMARFPTERLLETVDEQRQECCLTYDDDLIACSLVPISETVDSSDKLSKGDDCNDPASSPPSIIDETTPSKECNSRHACHITSPENHHTTNGNNVSPQVVSPPPTEVDKKTEENSHHLQQQNGSKSTQETEQSTQSSQDRDSSLKPTKENFPTCVSDDESTNDESCDKRSLPVVASNDESSIDDDTDVAAGISHTLDSSPLVPADNIHQAHDKQSTTIPGDIVAQSKADIRFEEDPKENLKSPDAAVDTATGRTKDSRSLTLSSHSKADRSHEAEFGSNKTLPVFASAPSPTNQLGPERREQREGTNTGKTQGRNRFVKALSSPFRRSRSKKQLLAGGLDALDEEREVKHFPTLVEQTDMEAHAAESFENAPVSYIDMRNRDDDDDQSQVSQITFKWEEQPSQKSNQDSQWWWGVTAEGLEGWFPTAYVHQAVEAAEGFLSARSIHEKVKSRPLDFDSDEESESDQDVSSAVQSKPRTSIEHYDASQSEAPAISDHSERKISVESSTKPSLSSDPLSAGQSVRSLPTKKLTLRSQIEEKEAHLQKTNISNEKEHLATTATILFELALLRSKNGEIGKALNNLQQALKIQKETKSLLDASKTLHLMAELRSKAKQYQAALLCYAESQKMQESIYGYYHEEIANTLNRKGNVLARQGEFDHAMENHKEALRILKECCGEEVKNPLVSQTLIQIGAVYYKERNSLKTIQKNRDGYTTFIESGMLEVIGRAHEDRGSYRMAIAFFEEKLQCLDESENSKELEQVAETLNSLGMLSCRAGLYLEAIDYYDRALSIQMKLGCSDVQLAMARVLAGSVQYSLGNFKKALKLFEDALRTLREKVGKEQETVAATLFHMGVVRVALYDFDEAMTNLKDAFKTQKKLLGNDHPATLRTRREIGNLCVAWTPELDPALNEFHAILEIQKRVHGEKHPNIAETLHVIGCTQARKGDSSIALQTLESCYNMRLEFLGMDHPLQATTLHEIAKIRLSNGRVKKALRICDSALHIRKESLSENHIDVAIATATKASCLVARGNFAEANKLFLEAHTIAKESVGEKHPVIADIHVQIGTMHLRKCHFEEAAASINKALDVYRASGLNEDHLGVRSALKELERVERAEMLCV